jgi:hypothetical protein
MATNVLTVPVQTQSYTSVSYTLKADDVGKTFFVQTSNTDQSPGASVFAVVFTLSEDFPVGSQCFLKSVDGYGNVVTVQFVSPNNGVLDALYSPFLQPPQNRGLDGNSSTAVLQNLFGNLLACA